MSEVHYIEDEPRFNFTDKQGSITRDMKTYYTACGLRIGSTFEKLGPNLVIKGSLDQTHDESEVTCKNCQKVLGTS